MSSTDVAVRDVRSTATRRARFRMSYSATVQIHATVDITALRDSTAAGSEDHDADLSAAGSVDPAASISVAGPSDAAPRVSSP